LPPNLFVVRAELEIKSIAGFPACIATHLPQHVGASFRGEEMHARYRWIGRVCLGRDRPLFIFCRRKVCLEALRSWGFLCDGRIRSQRCS